MRARYDSVYAVVRQIPFGRVSTYGRIARMLGNPRLARQVGYALHCAPEDVPCHRVVNRYGGLSEAFCPDGARSHRLLLELEGVRFRPDGTVELEGQLWPDPASAGVF